MKIYVSIDGVLRNVIQKFDYHYKDYYLESESVNENDFEYGIIQPIRNDNLLNHYKFQSKEEFEYFIFIEYPIEIFGHAGISYSTAFTDINKLIHNDSENEYYLIGMDEYGKSRAATLFFLSKNGFTGNNIKFSVSEKINELWGECDYWITDSESITKQCPTNKTVIKFNTDYNQHFTCEKEINKLTEINQLWSQYLEKNTTLTLTESQKNVK
jgi:hypothetical protein